MVWNERLTPHAYALLRVMTGVMFMLHGTQKLLGVPPSDQGGRPPLASLAGAGGVIELVAGFLVAIGLFTSVAAFLASGEMAVGYFMFHAPHGFLPLVNKGELAVLYCFVFLYMAAHGSGAWSVDSAMGRGGTKVRGVGAATPAR